MADDDRNIQELIATGEDLATEFKSDRRRLPDRELMAAVVALANTEGGDLLLGVEDDGTVTGLHAEHGEVSALASLIANRTNPPLTVRVERVDLAGTPIARICVPKSRQLVSTSEGLLQRRRRGADGKPEAVPFYPHEFSQRQASLGLVDPSAMLIDGLAVDELSAVERARLREAIRKYGGDQTLLPLADRELDGALGLIIEREGPGIRP